MKRNFRQHCPFPAQNDNQVFALEFTTSDAGPQRALQGHLALETMMFLTERWKRKHTTGV
jgi:hypothetical protein